MNFQDPFYIVHMRCLGSLVASADVCLPRLGFRVPIAVDLVWVTENKSWEPKDNGRKTRARGVSGAWWLNCWSECQVASEGATG